MNKRIVEQLKQCTKAKLPDGWENLSTIIIKQVEPIYTHLKVGDKIIVECDDVMMNGSTLFNINVNGGCPPLYNGLECKILAINNTAVKVEANYLNSLFSTQWTGQLLLSHIKIIKSC